LSVIGAQIARVRRRQQPKDAFDLLYTLMHYDRGLAVATATFAAEGLEKSPAFAERWPV